MVNVPLFNNVDPTVTEHHTAPDCINGGKVWFTISPDNGRNKVIYNADTVSSSYQFVDLPEGDHHFSVVDEYYCELAGRDIKMVLEGSCDTVYFPTAFTPNNDGRNDLFRGSGNRAVRNYQLAVYNRWGQVVFHSTNVLNGWDGKVNGVAEDTGVYIWMASYTTIKGVAKKARGTVLLIR
jgi:gliding motility-associated-like protein